MSSSTSTTSASTEFHSSSSNSRATPFWVDPHPGRRLSCSFRTSPELIGGAVGTQAIRDGCSDDMAAKENGRDQQSRPRAIRNNSRRCSDNIDTVLGHSHESDTDISQASTVVFSADPRASLNSMTSSRSSLRISMASERQQLDEPDIDKQLPGLQPVHQKLAVAPTTIYCDLSNLLDANAQPDAHLDVETTADKHEAHCRAAPDCDLYGWDAELDRQLQLGRTPTAASEKPCDCEVAFSYQKAEPTKRGLLQRVFSLSNTPRVTTVAMRRTDSSVS